MEQTHYYKYISHKLLLAFYVVAQEQSITKATSKLFVTQPTISLQIQSLERELGHTLFERRGPKIILTPKGRKFYELVQPIVTGFNSLKISFEDSLTDIETGEINIAVGQSTSLYILPNYIKEFKQKYPNIKVILRNCTGSELLDLIKNDTVDIAVGSLSEIPDTIDYQPFIESNLSLITSKKHVLSKKKNVQISDIAKYKLILPPRNLEIWQEIDSIFNKHKLKYAVAIETGGWEAVKKYVELNLGISIISDISIMGNEDLSITPVHKYFHSKDYGLISRKGRFLSPQIKEFIKLF